MLHGSQWYSNNPSFQNTLAYNNPGFQNTLAHINNDPEIREMTVRFSKSFLAWTAEFVSHLPDPSVQAQVAQEYVALGTEAYNKANLSLKGVLNWTANLLNNV